MRKSSRRKKKLPGLIGVRFGIPEKTHRFSLSLIFGVFAGVLGLLLSFYNAVATGPMIVLCAAAVFFGTLMLSKKNT